MRDRDDFTPEEVAELLARLAVTGSFTELPPLRRRYIRDFCGWIGICVGAIGFALAMAVAVRFM